MILLTATPHNGYKHSFRSLFEIVEPTDATFVGEKETIERRVRRNMVRRLKSQIYRTDKNGKQVPAFCPREPVKQLPIAKLSVDEKAIFQKVSSYCAKTAAAAKKEDDAELVSFAMQIIKKRMLSSRVALAETVTGRLEALSSKQPQEDPPPRAEIRELQGDLPLLEAAHDRIAGRIVRASVPKEKKRRDAEKRQLQEISKLIAKVQSTPDPKIQALLEDLRKEILPHKGEKAIIFTEYRDTLGAIKAAFEAEKAFQNTFVELTGGLSPNKRRQRMAGFIKSDIRFMLATDAASEGLNLQEHCRRLYHFELPWNPNRMEQRNGRIDRHGQTRNPIVRYLYYPDSPEDNVLGRLIRRIFQMQDDRVSTPDILGILSGARIEQILTDIDAETHTAHEDESLVKVFENGVEEFKKGVGSLLTSESVATYGKKIDPNSLSADPILEDDLDFERLVLDRLGDAAKKQNIPHSYSVIVPPVLRGPEVKDQYPCFTLRRSVAISHPSRDVEFITRLHPLFQAMLSEAQATLMAPHSPTTPTRRIALRRHTGANKMPYAVFTFLSFQMDIPRQFLAVAITPKEIVLQDGQDETALLASSDPGEADWKEIESAFGSTFASMQKKAEAAVMDQLQKRIKALAENRKKLAQVLSEDANCYRTDRLAEIDKEEKEARTMEEDQQLLLEVRDVSGFQKRRAAVDTFHKRRMEEIVAFEKVPAPQPPQPLGVLFVLPEKKR